MGSPVLRYRLSSGFLTPTRGRRDVEQSVRREPRFGGFSRPRGPLAGYSAAGSPGHPRPGPLKLLVLCAWSRVVKRARPPEELRPLVGRDSLGREPGSTVQVLAPSLVLLGVPSLELDRLAVPPPAPACPPRPSPIHRLGRLPVEEEFHDPLGLGADDAVEEYSREHKSSPDYGCGSRGSQGVPKERSRTWKSTRNPCLS
jgi:hypothetical protein